MHTFTEEITEIISEALGAPRELIENNKNSLLENVFDSFSLIQLVIELENKISFQVDMEDLTPENFNTLDSIVELINSSA